jgi:hypothetical protein
MTNGKSSWNLMKMKTQKQSLWDTAKAVAKRKFVAMNNYMKKRTSLNLMVLLKPNPKLADGKK